MNKLWKLTSLNSRTYIMQSIVSSMRRFGHISRYGGTYNNKIQSLTTKNQARQFFGRGFRPRSETTGLYLFASVLGVISGILFMYYNLFYHIVLLVTEFCC